MATIPSNPTNGQTIDIPYKISFATLGVGALNGQIITSAVENYLQKNLKNKLIASGFRIFPGFNIATWLVGAIATVYSAMGYAGIVVTVTMKYRIIRKHQGSRVVESTGWMPDGLDIALYK